jgi:NAD(P)H-dependent FMN reductase
MYLIFVSTLNENAKLAKVIQKQLGELNENSEIINLVEQNFPMYDTIKEQNDGIPQNIKNITQKMENAKGYIFVTAEYNYSLPPVLSNFIAWVSRSDENFRKVFTLKFIQLATHSGSGGNDVMNAMRTQFTKLGAIVMPREIITTYQTSLNENSSKKILQQLIALTN